MRFYKNELLIGEENINLLRNKKILLIGCGGVGGFCAEAIARSGIYNITIVDNDIIDITNINRQIISLTSNIGESKVDVLEKRIKEINPDSNVTKYKIFVDKDNIEKIVTKEYDYVIDAIDTITSKIKLIDYCYNNNINIISSMGMGNRISPEGIIIDDIFKTKYCPMAKVIRKELRKKNIDRLNVCYCQNEVSKRYQEPSSMIFAPSICGIKMAYKIVSDLIEV